MKVLFSNVMAVTVFLRLCELGRAPIWALAAALFGGACMSRAYELSFEQKKSVPRKAKAHSKKYKYSIPQNMQ